MPSSFEKLASYLTDDEKYITKMYCESNKEFNLLTRRGVFPYDYVHSWVRLEEERLPPIQAFYSKLNNKNISIQNYKHACKVRETFDSKTLGEYSDLHLRTDVLLIANIFGNFRKRCYETYNLDALLVDCVPRATWWRL